MVLEMGIYIYNLHCDDVPDFFNRCEPNISNKRWFPPQEDWVKLNVDAVVFSESENRSWICDMDPQCKFLGCCKPSILLSIKTRECMTEAFECPMGFKVHL